MEQGKAIERMVQCMCNMASIGRTVGGKLQELRIVSLQTLTLTDAILLGGNEGIDERDLHIMFHEVSGDTGNFWEVMRLVMETDMVEMVVQGPYTFFRIKQEMGQ